MDQNRKDVNNFSDHEMMQGISSLVLQSNQKKQSILGKVEYDILRS